jgi:hypothetical protein
LVENKGTAVSFMVMQRRLILNLNSKLGSWKGRPVTLADRLKLNWWK